MKIVIDIDDDLYVRLFDNGVDNYNDADDIAKAIRRGTPLPKGHGALVDRGEVIKNLLDYKKGKKTLGQCIEDVQTIVEVDWEDEEE